MPSINREGSKQELAENILPIQCFGDRTASAIAGTALLTILTVAAAVAPVALFSDTLLSAELRASLLANPMLAAEVAAAAVFWILLIGLPLKALIRAALLHRTVEIRSGLVVVRDEMPFSKRKWRQPLQSYLGVTIEPRPSVFGMCQAVMLVHRSPDRNVTLTLSEHIGHGELRALCRLLGLPFLARHTPNGRRKNSRSTMREAPTAVAA